MKIWDSIYNFLFEFSGFISDLQAASVLLIATLNGTKRVQICKRTWHCNRPDIRHFPKQAMITVWFLGPTKYFVVGRTGLLIHRQANKCTTNKDQIWLVVHYPFQTPCHHSVPNQIESTAGEISEIIKANHPGLNIRLLFIFLLYYSRDLNIQLRIIVYLVMSGWSISDWPLFFCFPRQHRFLDIYYLFVSMLWSYLSLSLSLSLSLPMKYIVQERLNLNNLPNISCT